jgi:hypothetical protein
LSRLRCLCLAIFFLRHFFALLTSSPPHVPKQMQPTWYPCRFCCLHRRRPRDTKKAALVHRCRHTGFSTNQARKSKSLAYHYRRWACPPHRTVGQYLVCYQFLPPAGIRPLATSLWDLWPCHPTFWRTDGQYRDEL